MTTDPPWALPYRETLVETIDHADAIYDGVRRAPTYPETTRAAHELFGPSVRTLYLGLEDRDLWLVAAQDARGAWLTPRREVLLELDDVHDGVLPVLVRDGSGRTNAVDLSSDAALEAALQAAEAAAERAGIDLAGGLLPIQLASMVGDDDGWADVLQHEGRDHGGGDGPCRLVIPAAPTPRQRPRGRGRT